MSVVEEATSTGQLDILKVLLDEENRSREAARLWKYDGSYIIMGWRGNDMTLAVMNGHSDVVRWLFEHTSDRRRNGVGALICAAGRGNLPIVQLLIPRHPWIDRHFLANRAATAGHLELLQWIVEHVLDGEKNCVRLSGRHLNVNKWLVASNLECDAEQAFQEACEEGHLPIVKWLTDYCASTENFFSCAKAENAFYGAVYNGHLEVVKWLIKRGFSVRRTGDVIYAAARRGHLEVVKYLHTQNFKADHRYTLEKAAKTGRLALVQWLWTQFKGDRRLI
ncbi:putative ankyrin repeat protein [Phytophthora citrophthora]|uniref:Ankyrin repeat protein n=1 Tax=Phytophthora citrophthora TaxID=4793 RepID=A0AAD9G1I7_9STRA|nr:putative ankyrin repeat protein [Phytophthora citrophthora]